MSNTPEDTVSYKRFTRTIADIANKPRTRTYTMIIFSLVAIMLLGWFAIRPTVRTIIRLRREIADKTVLNKKMDAKIASLITAQNSYNSIQSRLHLLDQAAPGDPDIISFVSDLRQIETQTNLAATQMNFKDVALASVAADLETKANAKKSKKDNEETSVSERTILDSVTVVSRTSGSFETIRSFLEAVSNLRRITSIQGLDLRSSSAQSASDNLGSGELQMSLDIGAYYKVNN